MSVYYMVSVLLVQHLLDRHSASNNIIVNPLSPYSIGTSDGIVPSKHLHSGTLASRPPSVFAL